MAVKKLLHTRFRVNDIERSVKFYLDALGLTVSRRHTSPRGAQLVFLATPNSAEEIELCQMPAGATPVQVQSDLTHLAFEVEDLREFAAELKAKGYDLISTVIHGGESLHEMKFGPKNVLVIGNEAHGVSEAVQERATRQLSIPMSGNVESLNAAVAGSICMFAIGG